MCTLKLLRTKHFHGALVGNLHQCTLKLSIGRVSALPWVLDVSFREDDCRIRQGHGAQNMAVLRHMALNLLRREVGHKRGIKARRKRAGWDRDYLLQVLTG